MMMMMMMSAHCVIVHGSVGRMNVPHYLVEWISLHWMHSLPQMDKHLFLSSTGEDWCSFIVGHILSLIIDMCLVASTSIGLGPQREHEDNGYISDLLVSKLLSNFDKSSTSIAPSTTVLGETKEALDEVEAINLRNTNATLTHQVNALLNCCSLCRVCVFMDSLFIYLIGHKFGKTTGHGGSRITRILSWYSSFSW
jgi:hypothetical protein